MVEHRAESLDTAVGGTQITNYDPLHLQFLKWARRYEKWWYSTNHSGFISVAKTWDLKWRVVIRSPDGKVTQSVCSTLDCAWKLVEAELIEVQA